jgi:hypothetical protein
MVSENPVILSFVALSQNIKNKHSSDFERAVFATVWLSELLWNKLRIIQRKTILQITANWLFKSFGLSV